jgi:fructose-bisphosphate aldolase, class II
MKLALHGTTGVPPDMLRDCIERGITKVNVNKVYLADYMNHFKKDAANQSITQFMDEGVPLVQRLVEELIDLCLSTGKAT